MLAVSGTDPCQDEGVEQQVVNDTVCRAWANEVVPSLSDFIRIPALSPAFDPDWPSSGQLDAAVEHLRAWLASREIPGATVEVVRLTGRTPVLLFDVPATPGAEDQGTVLLYGHLDKQPPAGEWSAGLDPWTPVVRDGRLYGRGSVDDGYAGYAAAVALEAVRAGGGAHARAVVLLETGEESGSPDLSAYVEHLGPRLGRVSLVVCLDSGGDDEERLWLTTSLRGMAQVQVTARVLESGQHSGIAGGIVPDSFRVLRRLLDRVEDPETGEITVPECHGRIPDDRWEEARATAEVTGSAAGAFPLHGATRPVADDDEQLLLNNGWRPTLSVIGASGMPDPGDAGNVLRAATTLALSFRLPPTVDSAAALQAIEAALTTDVPYGATVELSGREAADGWNAPELAPWLARALDRVSDELFGQPWRGSGLGGSIPFMGMLGQKYPEAQFVVTGALGPGSNAHVPDESLSLDYGRRVTEAIAVVLDAQTRA